MSSKSTGSKSIKFEYFELMDGFLGKEPNIVPVAIASSSSTSKIEKRLVEDEIEQPEEKRPKIEKKPKNNLEELKKIFEERETNVERRHKENMEKKK